MSLDERYIVKPIRKALQLLDVLAGESRPLTLSELAKRTALPKTTAFRYLYTLRASGMVIGAEDSEAYAISPRLASIARPAAAIETLKQLAMPEMQRLQARFNETVNLGIADGNDVVYVAMVGTTRSLRMEATMGARDPIHSTSLGKAMLALRPPAERLAGLPSRLARRTPRTLTGRAALALDLEQVAGRGFALDLEENELGAHCVAAAIPGSQPPAALSISGPAQRMPEAVLARLGGSLMQAAAIIAAKLAQERANG